MKLIFIRGSRFFFDFTHSGAHPSAILIDVTIAAHNSRAAGRASLPGCAAEARYAAKAASYVRDYLPHMVLIDGIKQ